MENAPLEIGGRKIKKVLVIAALNTVAATAFAVWVYEGEWGEFGFGNGKSNEPCGLCLNASGSRVYVADYLNNRFQYFKDTEYAVSPTSLGRLKALFT